MFFWIVHEWVIISSKQFLSAFIQNNTERCNTPSPGPIYVHNKKQENSHCDWCFLQQLAHETLSRSFWPKSELKKGKQLEWQGRCRSCLCQETQRAQTTPCHNSCVLQTALSKAEQQNNLAVTKHSLTGWEPAHAHGSYVPSKQQIDKSRLFSWLTVYHNVSWDSQL